MIVSLLFLKSHKILPVCPLLFTKRDNFPLSLRSDSYGVSSTVTSDFSSFFYLSPFLFPPFFLFSSSISYSVFYPLESLLFKPGLAVAPVGLGVPPAVGAGIGIPPFWAKSYSWSLIEFTFYWWTTSSKRLNLSIN